MATYAGMASRESMIRQQSGYYAALNASNADGASTRFIAFMLRAIRDAMEPYCASVNPSRRLTSP